MWVSTLTLPLCKTIVTTLFSQFKPYMSKSQSIEVVEGLLASLRAMKSSDRVSFSSAIFQKWHLEARLTIKGLFGESSILDEFSAISYHNPKASKFDPLQQQEIAFRSGLVTAENFLETIIQ